MTDITQTVELPSMLALAMELDAGATALEVRENKRALNEAAKLIKQEARKEIGVYQPQVGAYPAWEPLAESTEDEKARLGAPPDAPLLRWGDLQKSFRSDPPSATEVVVGSTDPVMEYHEFGTSKMPPRPALGPALYKSIEAIQKIIGGSGVRAIVGGQRMGYRFSASEGGIMNSGFDSGAPQASAYSSDED